MCTIVEVLHTWRNWFLDLVELDRVWNLDCDGAFPIDLYLCKSIEEVVMQSEAGSVWQDLWIRSSGCRPSKFIAVSFMCILWYIKLKKGKSETVLPLFSKFWDSGHGNKVIFESSEFRRIMMSRIFICVLIYLFIIHRIKSANALFPFACVDKDS